jgi:hypothetical protein
MLDPALGTCPSLPVKAQRMAHAIRKSDLDVPSADKIWRLRLSHGGEACLYDQHQNHMIHSLTRAHARAVLACFSVWTNQRPINTKLSVSIRDLLRLKRNSKSEKYMDGGVCSRKPSEFEEKFAKKVQKSIDMFLEVQVKGAFHTKLQPLHHHS